MKIRGLVALAMSLVVSSVLLTSNAQAQLWLPLSTGLPFPDITNTNPPIPDIISPPPPIFDDPFDWRGIGQNDPRPPTIFSSECCGYIRDVSLPFGIDSISWMDNHCGAVGGSHLCEKIFWVAVILCGLALASTINIQTTR